MPNTLHRKKLVVVGCGAAAVLLLADLAETLHVPIDIVIIDDNPAVPLGVAYSVNHPAFILNVAAKRMGAYINKPDDFYQWLLSNTEAWRSLHPDFSCVKYEADDFVPRMIYAKYLEKIFLSSIALLKQKKTRVFRVQQRVTAVTPMANTSDRNVNVSTSQQNIPADIVVFATGNNSDNNLIGKDKCCFSSPYTEEFLNCTWSSVNSVAILGAGLSMVDAVQFISSQGFTGHFHIISRHGLLPLPHCNEPPMAAAPLFNPEFVGSTALKVMRAVRAYVEANSEAGIEWQESINKVRPHVSHLWAGLSEHEQIRLARALPWWNIHRHRAPPVASARIQLLCKQQRLTMTRCHVTAINTTETGFQLRTSRDSMSDKICNISADKLVACNGYTAGFNRVKNLGGKLIITDDVLRSALLKSDAIFKISEMYNVFALGPALSGLLFESTALHETRQQAHCIAAAISDSSH